MTAKKSPIPIEQLEDVEKRLHDAEQDFCESFYRIGIELTNIRENKLWEQAGFDSWGAYCKSDRIDYTKNYANKLIKAAMVREILPELPKVGTTVPTWNERHCRELSRMLNGEGYLTRGGRAGIKRVCTQIIKRVKKGEPLTVKLVKDRVDWDLYGEKTPEYKSLEDYESELTLPGYLKGIWDRAIGGAENLRKVPDEAWRCLTENEELLLPKVKEALQELIGVIDDAMQNKSE